LSGRPVRSPPMAKPKMTKRDLWAKLGKLITGLTIVCFYLPFFGVSCEGMEFVTISGTDMVGGCRPGGMAAEMEDQAKARGMDGDDGGMSSSRKGDIKVDKVPVEPLAIVALVLAVGAFGLSWLRTRQGMIGVVVLSLACLGALAGVYVKVGGKLKDEIAVATKEKGMGGQMMRDSKVDAGSRFGLYAVCAGLIASAVLCGLALKERDPQG
jgi:hypothetical protein